MGEALVVSSELLFGRGRKHCSKHALCSQMAWGQIPTLSLPGCDLGHVTWTLPALVSSSINGDNSSVCHMSMRIKWTMYEKHCNSEQPQWTLNMIINIISKHCQLVIYRLLMSVTASEETYLVSFTSLPEGRENGGEFPQGFLLTWL